MRTVVEADLEDLAVGAAVLGTGGGGNPYIGKLLAQQAIRQHGPVTLVDVDEVPDDALVVPSAMMGAPTVMVEKLPRGDESIRAFRPLGTAAQTVHGARHHRACPGAWTPHPGDPSGSWRSSQCDPRPAARLPRLRRQDRRCPTPNRGRLRQGGSPHRRRPG